MSGPLKAERESSPNSFVAAFGKESFVREAGQVTALRVVLQYNEFDLEKEDVPDGKGGKNSIFYLNISPEHDPELFNAAADWYKEQIIVNDISVLVIPNSHKSTEAFQEGVKRVKEESGKDVRLIELLGGKNMSDVNDARQDLVEFYVPITTPGGKWMGMSAEDAAYLQAKADEAEQKGEKLRVCIGDDVKSSRKTEETMQKIIGHATGDKAETISMFIAVEVTDNQFPQELDPGKTIAAMEIIEIVGGV